MHGSAQTVRDVQSPKQNFAVNRVEGCREIQHHQSRQVSIINSEQDIRQHLQHSSLSGMIRAVCRLQPRKETTGVKMSLELPSNEPFEEFGEDGKVGNWTVLSGQW